MTEEEYCIWNFYLGQMDTSTDWGKLFDLVQKQPYYRNFSIIPTRMVGKGKYRTLKQMNAAIRKAEIRHKELMKK